MVSVALLALVVLAPTAVAQQESEVGEIRQFFDVERDAGEETPRVATASEVPTPPPAPAPAPAPAPTPAPALGPKAEEKKKLPKTGGNGPASLLTLGVGGLSWPVGVLRQLTQENLVDRESLYLAGVLLELRDCCSCPGNPEPPSPSRPLGL